MPGRRAGPLIAAASGLLVACYPSPGDPDHVPRPPAPFVRAPYVQNVGSGSASVLWMRDAPPGGDTAWFRPAGSDSSAWRAAPPAPRDQGVREAHLAPLPPGVTVEYAVGVEGVRFGPWRFDTAPRPGAGDSVRVLLFGDSGWGTEPQVELARRMRRLDWDLAIHVGDVAYDDGSSRELTERHFRVYREMLAGTPVFPAIGNHDLRADGGRSFDLAFDWPAPVEGARWYSFRWGPALFVALDTSSPTDAVRGLRRGEGPQFDWLERTLRAAQADAGVAWTVVYLHHPPFSHAVGLSGHGRDHDVRRFLVPLFERYGVDLVAAGHDHHYERSVPIRANRAVAPGCGPVYVVQGAGGGSMYARDVGTSPLQAARARTHSFTRLVLYRDRIEGRTIAADGTELDTFVLRPWPGPGAPECAP
jgi:acid phosphatase type 7